MTTTLTLADELLALAGKVAEQKWIVAEGYDHLGEHPRIHGGDKLIACVGNSEEWISTIDEWDANAAFIAKSCPTNITALCLAVKVLSEENARLREALKPFAEANEMFSWPCGERDDFIITSGTRLTVGDIRRAALAAGEKK